MLTNRHENTTEWPKSYAPFAVIAIQKYVQAIKRPTRPTLHICIMMCLHLSRVIPKRSSTNVAGIVCGWWTQMCF